MRRFLTLLAAIGLFSVLAFAETYTGKLIDASCLSQPKPTLASCQPSSTTTTFALVDESQKVYKLDESGNSKAANALKSRADRSSDPNAGESKGAAIVIAKISGTMNGNVITVNSIEVQ